MHTEVSMERLRLRQILLNRYPICPVCRTAKTEDLHEIVSRGRTWGNGAAREASFARELVVPLCRNCHQAAHNPRVRQILLRHNIALYGREAVIAALERVQQHLSYRLDIWQDLEEVTHETRPRKGAEQS